MQQDHRGYAAVTRRFTTDDLRGVTQCYHTVNGCLASFATLLRTVHAVPAEDTRPVELLLRGDYRHLMGNMLCASRAPHTHTEKKQRRTQARRESRQFLPKCS